MEFINSVSWFDAMAIMIVLVLGLKGLLTGAVKEIFSILGLIGGVALASRYGDAMARAIDSYVFKFDNAGLMATAGFLSTFAAVWFAILLLGAFFSKILRLSGLGLFDKMGGFVMASLKTFFILSLFCALLVNSGFLSQDMQKYISNSKLCPFFVKTGSWILNQDSVKSLKNIDELIKKESK